MWLSPRSLAKATVVWLQMTDKTTFRYYSGESWSSDKKGSCTPYLNKVLIITNIWRRKNWTGTLHWQNQAPTLPLKLKKNKNKTWVSNEWKDLTAEMSLMTIPHANHLDVSKLKWWPNKQQKEESVLNLSLKCADWSEATLFLLWSEAAAALSPAALSPTSHPL